MAKYQNLTDHLDTRSGAAWTASFKEIEGILGFALPASARLYPAWWSNQADGGHAQSRAWQSAGWTTSNLDLKTKKITFTKGSDHKSAAPAKAAAPAAKPAPPAPAAPVRTAGGLTMAEAKAGLALHFGVPAGHIEIIIRG